MQKQAHLVTILMVTFAVLGASAALICIKKSYYNQGQSPVIYFNSTEKTDSKNSNMPKTLLRKVPFTAQAPTGNWDKLHNEACEEAVLIMANEYFSKNTALQLPAQLVESELSKLTKWQNENFGFHLDTTLKETAKMAQEVYGLKTKILENFSAEDIKLELLNNRLLIIPEAGRLLQNPNYKRPGPIYHMLLIHGYDSDDNFITNDPGTKNGLNYPYTFDTLYNAAADWDHSIANIDQSKKYILVVWK